MPYITPKHAIVTPDNQTQLSKLSASFKQLGDSIESALDKLDTKIANQPATPILEPQPSNTVSNTACYHGTYQERNAWQQQHTPKPGDLWHVINSEGTDYSIQIYGNSDVGWRPKSGVIQMPASSGTWTQLAGETVQYTTLTPIIPTLLLSSETIQISLVDTAGAKKIAFKTGQASMGEYTRATVTIVQFGDQTRTATSIRWEIITK